MPARYRDEILPVTELTPELEQGEPANNDQGNEGVELEIHDSAGEGMDVEAIRLQTSQKPLFMTQISIRSVYFAPTSLNLLHLHLY